MIAPTRIDFATLKRPGSPNTFLMAPLGLCQNARPDDAAPIYHLSAAKLRQEFLRVILSEPRVSHLLADERALYDDLVARSAILHFPDLVSVKFLGVNNTASTLALYSRAVYGFSDLGVNRRRTVAWITKVNGVIKPHNA